MVSKYNKLKANLAECNQARMTVAGYNGKWDSEGIMGRTRKIMNKYVPMCSWEGYGCGTVIN